MKRILLSISLGIAFALLITSCATLLNESSQRITVNTDKNIKLLEIPNALYSEKESNTAIVARDSAPLKLRVQIDSTQRMVYVRSQNSFAYWVNIYFNYGIGMLVDKDNPKRYAYPKQVYLQQQDTQIVVRRFAPITKGSIYWHLSANYMSYMYLSSEKFKTPNNKQVFTSLCGLETGIDYFYQDDHYVSFYAGAEIVTINYYSNLGMFLSLRDNWNIGRLNVGYGMSYATMFWRKSISQQPQTEPQGFSYLLGSSINASYRCGEIFQIGLLYQPYFFEMRNRAQFNYQHQVSIKLSWKLPLHKN